VNPDKINIFALMESLLENSGRRIRKGIDFFYPPFRRYMTLQFFRYGVTGTLNLVFDWTLYFLIYNYLLRHRMLRLGFVTLSSHIGTMALKIPVILLSGFLLQKYVTFSDSCLKRRVQLFRYSVVFLINLFINYFGLKLLVDGLDFWPTPSNIMLSVLTVFISYFSQKWYTFKTR
jgi:putative flippase GtrA